MGAKRGGQQWPRIVSGFKNPKPTVEKCKVCGRRIRGENHEQGGHHKGSVGYVEGASKYGGKP